MNVKATYRAAKTAYDAADTAYLAEMAPHEEALDFDNGDSVEAYHRADVAAMHRHQTLELARALREAEEALIVALVESQRARLTGPALERLREAFHARTRLSVRRKLISLALAAV